MFQDAPRTSVRAVRRRVARLSACAIAVLLPGITLSCGPGVFVPPPPEPIRITAVIIDTSTPFPGQDIKMSWTIDEGDTKLVRQNTGHVFAQLFDPGVCDARPLDSALPENDPRFLPLSDREVTLHAGRTASWESST